MASPKPTAKKRAPLVIPIACAGALCALWSLGSTQVPGDAPEEATESSKPDVRVQVAAAPHVAVDSQAASSPAPAAPTWAENELLVMVSDQAVLEAIARDHGVDVASSVRRSGFGVLDTTAIQDRTEAVASLRGDARLLWSGPHAVMHGAGKGGKQGGGGESGGGSGDNDPPAATDTGGPGSDGGGSGGGGLGGNPWDAVYRQLQWHVEDARVPTDLPDVSGITVAVLDTGVAYRSAAGKGNKGAGVTAAPSLSSSTIVAPYDFVNDDEFPDDDHFHGTHIATTIAGHGDIMGIAPGAAIMPLKVLDADNSGYEIDLVEAIHHAVDNGADVINMSLAFGSGYLPSPAMSAALNRAVDAGVILVGAAGNDGLARVSFPAASPAVVAVASSCPDGAGGHVVAPYSNVGVAVDLAAPGGCLDRDNTADSYPDGILAETISPEDPSKIEMWMFAGTSQAAAVVSGAVAHALALGADPETLPLRLRAKAVADLGPQSVQAGYGTGTVSVARTNARIESGITQGYMKKTYGVGMVPWLEDAGTHVRPRARLTVVDDTGSPAIGMVVYVAVTGVGTSVQLCKTDFGGRCDIAGEPMSRLGSDGSPAALAWGLSVEGVELDTHLYRPESMLFATDALEGVLTALHHDEGIDYPLLAFEWDATTSDLGDHAEAWTIVDSGAGISTSPFGLVLTPPAADLLGPKTTGTISGAGITTSPFGYSLLSLTDVTLSYGSGITTSPFGLQPITVVTFSGSGITTSPFGIRTVYEDPGDGGETFMGEPVLMGSGTFTGSMAGMAGGTELGALVGSGGFVSLDGYAGASVLSESGSVPMTFGTASGGVQAHGEVRIE